MHRRLVFVRHTNLPRLPVLPDEQTFSRPDARFGHASGSGARLCPRQVVSANCGLSPKVVRTCESVCRCACRTAAGSNPSGQEAFLSPVRVMTSKMSYGVCQMAGGFEGSVSKPTPPSDHIPLGRRCAFQWSVLNLRVACFGQYHSPRSKRNGPRAGAGRPGADELCSVYGRFCGHGLRVRILPPQPDIPAFGPACPPWTLCPTWSSCPTQRARHYCARLFKVAYEITF